MSSISFEPNSLLYGESCLWLFTFALIPFQLWPDLDNTKTKHVLGGTWFANRILNNLTRWRLTQIVQLFSVYLVTSCQMLYATLTIIYGSAVQENHLFFLNKRDPEELGYKCLYYTPLLISLVTSFNLIASYIYRSRYIEWETFDHYKIFAIDSWHQFKIMAFCVLIAFPDCVRLWVDMLFIITFLRSERYNMLQFTLSSREVNLAFLAFAMLMNTSSAVFKYKPIIIVIYSEICLASHLRVLHDKINTVYNGKSIKSRAATTSKWTASKQQATRNSNGASAPVLRSPDVITKGKDGLDVPSRFDNQKITARDLNEYSNEKNRNNTDLDHDEIELKQHRDSSRSEKRRQTIELRDRPKIILNEHGESRVSTMTLAQVEECCGDRQLAKRGEYRISCLFEFERHLTQLSLFAAAIDQQTPSITYATLVTIAMSIFYSILYVGEIPTKEWDYLYAFLYLAGPTLPLYVLFKSGQAIEKECDRITTLIEIFHWDSNSHLMVYKQLKSTQHSLKRVFKLLDKIQFNCDHLIEINMKNYWTILLYISGAVFIVLQYDSLLDHHRKFAPAFNGTRFASDTSKSWANETTAGRRTTTFLDSRYRPRLFG